MASLSVSASLDHARSSDGSRFSRFCWLVAALAHVCARFLSWLSHISAAGIRRRKHCRAPPQMPAEVVALIISFFSPSHLDPLEASDERITFYVTCMLVNKAWAAAARRCLHADLLIEHPSHPLLRTNDLVDPKHVQRITLAPARQHLGRFWLMRDELCDVLPLCKRLTALAVIGGNGFDLGRLSCASNLRELRFHDVILEPLHGSVWTSIYLPRLQKLSLSRIDFARVLRAYSFLLDPHALPQLRSLSLHLCNVSWAYFPTDRLFPLLQSLSFTHVESFPSSHLEQFILPSLGTLTLCTGALTELLTRPHRTLSRAYELGRSAPALRIVEGADGESPPVWTGWRSRSFPFAGELSLAHSRSTGFQASFSRSFTSPDTRQAHRGPAAPGSRESHLTASVRWMFAPWAQLAPLLRARASVLEDLAAHLLSPSAMTNSVLEELILPFSWADPGTPLSARFRTAAEPTEVQLLRCALEELQRVCRERGVRVTFGEAGAEERGRMERAKGWVGSG